MRPHSTSFPGLARLVLLIRLCRLARPVGVNVLAEPFHARRR